jgi:hypothetical protein
VLIVLFFNCVFDTYSSKEEYFVDFTKRLVGKKLKRKLGAIKSGILLQKSF